MYLIADFVNAWFYLPGRHHFARVNSYSAHLQSGDVNVPASLSLYIVLMACAKSTVKFVLFYESWVLRISTVNIE